MINKILLSLCILFVCGIAAQVSAKNDDIGLSVNITMSKVGDIMEELLPIILNNERYNDPDNSPFIENKIQDLVQLFSKARPHFEGKTETFKISYDVLLLNIKEAQNAYKTNSVYTQNLLREITSICTSCHTQDAKQRTLFKGANRESFANDLDYAEFNFLTRNYPDAIKYFDKYLLASKKGTNEKQILSALNRELLIYTQIYNNPVKGAEHFQKYVATKKFSRYVNANLGEWVEGLENLKNSDLLKTNLDDFNNLETTVYKVFGATNKYDSAVVPSKRKVVSYIWLRGQLYRYFMDKSEKQEIPKLLFWLSIIDRATNYSHYYSFADLYLTECIVKYTQDPFAKLCFDEYEDYVTFSYSGSMGTNLPPDVKKELERLEKMVYPQ